MAAEKGRQRQSNVAGGRSHHHRVAVSDEQEKRLQEAAASAGVTVSRLLVESALSARPVEPASARRAAMVELFAIHRLLATVANNVNQIAKVANTSGRVPAQASEVLKDARQLAGRIDEVLDGLAS